ncbi:uncharacterized protein LOC135704360 [Ochlerotatus camptorhynchus]|uniref:uncharacterized protein LOC135704360 n=1 Tax=Ochlerotatus camptorhynchus TaxID=644619 RepID=UPI0031D3041B
MATRKKLKDRLTIRKSLISSFEAMESFVENYEEASDILQVPVRLEMLNQLYQEFIKVQADIERFDSGDAPLARHFQERNEVESRYCAVKGWLMSQILAEPAPVNETINAQRMPASFHFRLPKIDLPKFDGDYSRWLGFRDTFKSMVHDVPEIPPVAKLQFLLQSLERDARKPYETVDIEADNYGPTWEALLKRYDDQHFLKKQLFRALYDLTPIRKESPEGLHTLVDDFQRHVKALAKLREAVDTWDTPLVCMLSYKLDSASLRAWEEHSSKMDQVTYANCIEFLYQRIRVLQTVSSEMEHRHTPVKVAGTSPFRKPQQSRSVANTAVASPRSSLLSCISCSEKHLLVQCPTFQRLSVGQRRELIAQKRLCWNCFKSSHVARNCDSKFSCRLCHERHHTLLHQSQPSPSPQKCSVAPEVEPPASSSTVRSVESSVSAHPATEVSLPAHARSSSTAFLCTFVLTVLDEDGNEHFARALIDSGSQSNFISKRLASRLSLKPERAHILITGVGESATRVSQLVYASIRSRDEYYTSELEFLVLPTLMTELPGRDVDISDWYIPKTVELAHPNFNINSPIVMILGADQFHEYLRNGRIHLNRGSPTLIETIFGWAVSGRWYSNFPRIPLRCCTATTTHNLESLMEKFWDIESINTGRIYSADEVACDELYHATTIRNADGRYVVALPKSQNPHIHLGESRAIAERRLRSLERWLERDEAVKVAYHEFMDEYLRLGHMRRLEDPVDDSLMHYSCRITRCSRPAVLRQRYGSYSMPPAAHHLAIP